jgi:outer membrane protein insertion porin family
LVEHRLTSLLFCQIGGWALRSTSEVSGLGFDRRLQFAKQHLEWQALLPVSPSVTLSLSASVGMMLPWGVEGNQGTMDAGSTSQPAAAAISPACCIADRFFIGGPSTLRGFKFKGLGYADP